MQNKMMQSENYETLFSLEGPTFLHAAYRLGLGRSADSDGMNYYLNRLARGENKKDILFQIVMSKEGKKRIQENSDIKIFLKKGQISRKIHFLFFKKNNVEFKIQEVNERLTGLHMQLSQYQQSMAQVMLMLKDFSLKLDQNSHRTELQESLSNPSQDSKSNPKENTVSEKIQVDEKWYLEEYPDVAVEGISAIKHYELFGRAEGRHPAFDQDWYIERYPDIANSDMTPFEHYIKFGRAEGRFPAYSPKNKDKDNYAFWVEQYDQLTDEVIEAVRRRMLGLKKKPLISVVMPVYNPKAEWLQSAIESVRNQVYENWELCIADDFSPNEEIRKILKLYASIDNRIKTIFRTENGHISRASNSALALATGEWIALMDHDDLLPRHALTCVAEAINEKPHIRLIYSDEDKIDEQGRRTTPYFKCDWNLDLFRSQNMVCHLGVYQAELVKDLGGFRVGYEGSQDYDLALRCIEKLTPSQIHHIPRILYHWRIHAASTAASIDVKPYAVLAGEKALNEHLKRMKLNATALAVKFGYRLKYDLPTNLPLVSLIIPTRDGFDLLNTCIKSIEGRTTYKNYEIIIIDNGSTDNKTLNYLNELSSRKNIKILRDDRPFNYSELMNFGVGKAKGEIIGLVNNDIEVIAEDWLSEMVSHVVRPGVGAVGAKLLYPDGSNQHAGVVIGIGGVAGHAHKNLPGDSGGYFGRSMLIQSYTAVTAACLLVTKEAYNTVNGLNERDLKVAFNDVEFCLKLVDAGYTNIWTPYAELYHHESATRGDDMAPEKRKRFQQEAQYMINFLNGRQDPAYSPNLTLDAEDLTLAWPPRIKSLLD